MIICLERTETIEMAETYLKEMLNDPEESHKAKGWLYHQTDLDFEDLKYKVDVYCRKG